MMLCRWVPVALLSVHVFGLEQQKWFFFEGYDCDYQDVTPEPACRTRDHNVSSLKECCIATKGCFGFNTNGIMKNESCAKHMNTQKCDLYVLQNGTQPPPTPPIVVSIWPAPKYARYGSPRQLAILNPAGFTTQCVAASSNHACDAIVTPSLARANLTMFFFKGKVNTTAATLSSLTVILTSTDATPLQYGVDESYTLDINSTHAVIKAPTEWGVSTYLAEVVPLSPAS